MLNEVKLHCHFKTAPTSQVTPFVSQVTTDSILHTVVYWFWPELNLGPWSKVMDYIGKCKVFERQSGARSRGTPCRFLWALVNWMDLHSQLAHGLRLLKNQRRPVCQAQHSPGWDHSPALDKRKIYVLVSDAVTIIVCSQSRYTWTNCGWIDLTCTGQYPWMLASGQWGQMFYPVTK